MDLQGKAFSQKVRLAACLWKVCVHEQKN